ncbi:MAG: stage II sporulation protein M [Bacilli bacterium]
MNGAMKKARDNIIKQKRIYLFLFILLLIGVGIGIVFVTILSNGDKKIVMEQLGDFFKQFRTMDNLNYGRGLMNSLLANLLYVIGVWLLGISIIGLPVILFLLFMKGFIVGFSISSIISIYGFKGVLGVIAYLFPHHLLGLLMVVVLSFYAVTFSIKLFLSLFLHKNINLRAVMHKYIKILLLMLVIAVVVSLLEIFINPYLINLFTKII